VSWNHRIIRYTDGEGTTHFGIHEVYYGSGGEPEMYTENPVAPYGESLDELRRDIEHMMGAFNHPVLTDADFKKEGKQ
jgi:hypothetical protein